MTPALPIFLFHKDQMIVTGHSEIRKLPPRYLEDLEAFDSAGRRLKVEVKAASLAFLLDGSGPDETAFRGKILAFWNSSGNPVPGLAEMRLDQAVAASLEWLKVREWKTYRRGLRLYWTLMLPCGIVPFAIGLFKIAGSSASLALYAGCFAAAALLTVALQRALYKKPPFPDPSAPPPR